MTADWSAAKAKSLAAKIGLPLADPESLADALDRDMNLWFELSKDLSGRRKQREKEQVAELAKVVEYAHALRKLLGKQETKAHLLGQRGIPAGFLSEGLFALLDGEEETLGTDGSTLVSTKLGLLTQIGIAAGASIDYVPANETTLALLASGSPLEVLVGKFLSRTYSKHFGAPVSCTADGSIEYDENGDPETPFVLFVEGVLNDAGLRYSRSSIFTALSKKGRRKDHRSEPHAS